MCQVLMGGQLGPMKAAGELAVFHMHIQSSKGSSAQRGAGQNVPWACTSEAALEAVRIDAKGRVTRAKHCVGNT